MVFPTPSCARCGRTATGISGPVPTTVWRGWKTTALSRRLAANGDLLVATRSGIAQMPARVEGSRFRNYSPPDPLGRKGIFDALEDSDGRLWLATPAGLSVDRGKQLHTVVAGGPLLIDFVVTLGQGRDGAIWAGT